MPHHGFRGGVEKFKGGGVKVMLADWLSYNYKLFLTEFILLIRLGME